MRSAREIACTPEMGDCGAGARVVVGGFSATWAGHSSECDARTEAIEQAREDGARWMKEQALDWTLAQYDDQDTAREVAANIEGINPADARTATPTSGEKASGEI